MYSNSPLAFLLPPITPEEYSWIYELTKEEKEYYKLKSPKPKMPPPGVLLILREPYTSMLKIFYPDGTHIAKNFGRYTIDEIVRLGVNRDQLVKAIDHCWQFGRVYIRTEHRVMTSPEIKTAE